jgi:hypothetical protein
MESAGEKEMTMSKNPIDHDHDRDDAKVAKEYSRIEREQADEAADPKVKAMTKAAHGDEAATSDTRLKKFLKIDRETGES